MKQTAVEWLVEQFEKHHVHQDLKNTVAFYQAKAMEKEHIEDAFDTGTTDDDRIGKEYYNETYNK